MSLSIYKSSAGSGKTYTLAKEYLKLLLQNPLQHSQILAVTFTNKATQEMKERIIKFLIALTKNQDDALLKQLKAETTYSDSHIQQNAKKALQNILHNYGDFSIVTIDSFFNSVIKAFAHELKLPLRMEVQLDTNEVLEDAYDRLMIQLGTDRELAEYITNFMFYKLDHDKGWYVEREIKDLGMQLFKESFDPVFKSLDKIELSNIKKLIEETVKYISRVNNQIKDLGNEWFELLDTYGLEISDFSYGKGGVGNFGTHLLDVNIEKLREPGTRVLGALDDLNKWHKKKDANAQAIQGCASNGLIDIINKALQIWEDEKSKYQISLMLFKNLHALGLLKNINNHIKAYRDENDKILISDQNRFINEIVSQSEIPFLYEKTGAKYRHFLLDEFQDTSTLQWVNFKPLLENALADGGRVLVVGDGKQSIYRWRGGEMTLLLQKIGDDLAFFHNKDTVKNLNENYRSKAEVIAFNNLFFKNIEATAAPLKKLAQSPLAQLAFKDVEQKTTPFTKNGGFVEINFFEKTEDEDGNKINARELVDEKLLATVKDLIAEGYNFGDLACLVFTNTQGARIAELLSAENIPVQSNDSLLLKNAASVQLLISLLKHLQNKNDELIRGEVFLLLWQMGLIDKNDFHTKILSAKSNFSDFYAILSEEMSACLGATSGNLLQQVNHLIAGFNLQEYQPEYLQRFTELVYQFEVNHESNLSDFIEWWKETNHSHCIQTPDSQNAVVITTIHRSKGLQYPVVLLPYAKRSINTKSSEILWLKNETLKEDWLDYVPLNYKSDLEDTPYKKAYEEETELSLVDALNMLYVAFTRPEDRLYIFATHKEMPTPSTASLMRAHLEKDEDLKKYFSDETFSYGEKGAAVTRVKKSLSTAQTKLAQTDGKRPKLRKPRLCISDIKSGQVLPFQKGVLAHKLLSEINSVAEIPKVLTKAASDGIIEQGELEFWTNKLEEILSIPLLKEWRTDALEQLNEQEILTSTGIFIPDKIFVLPNKIVVLDYKTGKPKPEHEEQVLEYVSLVSDLDLKPQNKKSDTLVEAYLLYTQSMELKKVELNQLSL